MDDTPNGRPHWLRTFLPVAIGVSAAAWLTVFVELPAGVADAILLTFALLYLAWALFDKGLAWPWNLIFTAFATLFLALIALDIASRWMGFEDLSEGPLGFLAEPFVAAAMLIAVAALLFAARRVAGMAAMLGVGVLGGIVAGVWWFGAPDEPPPGVSAMMLLGFATLLLFGSVFLLRAFFDARNAALSVRRSIFLGFGTLALGTIYWWAALAVATVTYLKSNEPIAFASWDAASLQTQVLYIVEQILAGCLLDIIEVYRLQMTDITYGPDERVFATLTLLMRLTGSAVLAVLIVRVFARKPDPA